MKTLKKYPEASGILVRGHGFFCFGGNTWQRTKMMWVIGFPSCKGKGPRGLAINPSMEPGSIRNLILKLLIGAEKPRLHTTGIEWIFELISEMISNLNILLKARVLRVSVRVGLWNDPFRNSFGEEWWGQQIHYEGRGASLHRHLIKSEIIPFCKPFPWYIRFVISIHKSEMNKY